MIVIVIVKEDRSEPPVPLNTRRREARLSFVRLGDRRTALSAGRHGVENRPWLKILTEIKVVHSYQHWIKKSA